MLRCGLFALSILVLPAFGCASSAAQKVAGEIAEQQAEAKSGLDEGLLLQAHWVEVKDGKGQITVWQDAGMGTDEFGKWRGEVSRRVGENKNAPLLLSATDPLLPEPLRRAFVVHLAGQPRAEVKADGAVATRIKAGPVYNTTYSLTYLASGGVHGLAVPAGPNAGRGRVTEPVPLDNASARGKQVIELLRSAAKAKAEGKGAANPFEKPEEAKANAEVFLAKLAPEHVKTIPGHFGKLGKEVVVANVPTGAAPDEVLTARLFLEGDETSMQGDGFMTLMRIKGHESLVLLSDLDGDGVEERVFERSDEAFVRTLQLDFLGHGGMPVLVTLYEEER